MYVPVPLPRYFTTKQSAYFCESLSPFLSSEPLFIQEHISSFLVLMNVRRAFWEKRKDGSVKERLPLSDKRCERSPKVLAPNYSSSERLDC